MTFSCIFFFGKIVRLAFEEAAPTTRHTTHSKKQRRDNKNETEKERKNEPLLRHYIPRIHTRGSDRLHAPYNESGLHPPFKTTLGLNLIVCGAFSYYARTHTSTLYSEGRAPALQTGAEERGRQASHLLRLRGSLRPQKLVS